MGEKRFLAVILRTAGWCGEFLSVVMGRRRLILATGFVAVPLRPAIPTLDLGSIAAGPVGYRLIRVTQTPLNFRADGCACSAHPACERFDVTANADRSASGVFLELGNRISGTRRRFFRRGGGGGYRFRRVRRLRRTNGRGSRRSAADQFDRRQDWRRRFRLRARFQLDRREGW